MQTTEIELFLSTEAHVATPAVELQSREPVAPKAEPVAVLTRDEASELEICEGIIERTLDSMVEGSFALVTIRDKRLYRVSFDTFEDYVTERWAMSVRQAHRLCFAANVTKSIAVEAEKVTPGSLLPMPTSEKQVRALNRLDSDADRVAVWKEACTEAAGRPTSKDVERIVDARLGVIRPVSVKHPTTNEMPLETKTATVRMVNAEPAGNKEQRARDALRRAIVAARDLVDTLGTADSMVTARATLTLEQLEEIEDHMVRLQRMQAARG